MRCNFGYDPTMPLRLLYFLTILLLIIVASAYFYLRFKNKQALNNNPQSSLNLRQLLTQRQTASLEAIRLPVTLLFVFSILLIWFGQLVYPRVRPSQVGWVVGVMVIGFLLFVVGAQLAVRQKMLTPMVTAVHKICAYFKIKSWQLLLFCIAPLYVAMTSIAAGDQLIANHALVASLSWIILIGLLIAANYQSPSHQYASHRHISGLPFQQAST